MRLPLLAGAAFVALAILFFADSYIVRLMTFVGIDVILVLGYQFIFGHAGALSLAQGAFFGLGAYVTAIAGTQTGWDFPFTFALSIVLPLALAAVVAVPVLRLESHYFALATLGIAQVLFLVGTHWVGLTGGANGIPGIPGIRFLSWHVAHGRPTLIFIWIVVVLCAAVAWRTVCGLRGFAYALAREHPVAAASQGIDVARLRFVGFLFSAAYAGVAGALYAHTLGVISPEVFAFPVMIGILIMAVIGGRTQIGGAVIGAALFVGLPEVFRFLGSTYLIAFGVATLIILAVAPNGIAGSIEALFRARRPRVPAPDLRAPPAAPFRRSGPAAEVLLEVCGATKIFGGVRALAAVDVTLARGEILGIIGPNGSGKTTLLNCVSGVYRLDAGRVRFAGADVTRRLPHERARAGMARTFQHGQLIDDVSALDNVAVAHFALDRTPFVPFLRDRAERRLGAARERALWLLTAVGAGDRASDRCGALPDGVRRRVEVARALALDPPVLLLDEPAAGLNETDQLELAAALRRCAEAGLTLAIVEHNMPFLLPLATRMICLDAGKVLAHGSPTAVSRDPAVIEAYLGTPLIGLA